MVGIVVAVETLLSTLATGQFPQQGRWGANGRGQPTIRQREEEKTNVHYSFVLFEQTSSYGGYLEHPERHACLLLNVDRLLRSGLRQWEVQM